MRSNIYGTEVDRGLQTIVESMHPTAQIAAQAMAEDDTPVGEKEHEASGSGLQALNTLAQKYGCDNITQCLTLMADVPGSNFVGELEDILGDPDEFKDAFELESTEEEATDTDEEPVDEGGCASHRKKKKTITAGHCN